MLLESLEDDAGTGPLLSQDLPSDILQALCETSRHIWQLDFCSVNEYVIATVQSAGQEEIQHKPASVVTSVAKLPVAHVLPLALRVSAMDHTYVLGGSDNFGLNSQLCAG